MYRNPGNLTISCIALEDLAARQYQGRAPLKDEVRYEHGLQTC
jgi:hypothetical protein